MKQFNHRKQHSFSNYPRQASSFPLEHNASNNTSISSLNNKTNLNPFEVPQEKCMNIPSLNRDSPLKVSPSFSTTSSSYISMQTSLLTNKPSSQRKRFHSFQNSVELTPKQILRHNTVSNNEYKTKKEKRIKFNNPFVEVINVQNWKQLFIENKNEERVENKNMNHNKRNNLNKNKNNVKCKCVII